ncbi:oxidoreductase [Sphingomonas sp. ABOLF]|uniref:phage tail protein n=1 Tax=Sphingomonas sp. ABOLF TaxID=1985879 RepID=UPI000F7D60C9|nr:phage tail protein [Sphingomonas sp. ABOLF]RSV12300.1 oxidoreductase [Sphingomonas sp. ABOLF]
MLMALGMFPFDLPLLAYDELQRRTDWRHARNPRVGARDATQFTGPGDDTITLSGTAYAELCDGRASLDELRRMADAGEARSLVDGAGYIYGAFVITALDEKHKAILPDGTPLRIDFSLDLLRVDVEPLA